MKVGDAVKYSRKTKAVILQIEGNYALIKFESGTKICTNINGLSYDHPPHPLHDRAKGATDRG